MTQEEKDAQIRQDGAGKYYPRFTIHCPIPKELYDDIREMSLDFHVTNARIAHVALQYLIAGYEDDPDYIRQLFVKKIGRRYRG